MIQSGIIHVNYLRPYSPPIHDPAREKKICKSHEELKDRLNAKQHDAGPAILGLLEFLEGGDMVKFKIPTP
jgi:hypothetical protein